MDGYPNFVDLNRQFGKLDLNRDPEETALDSYVAASLGVRHGLGWTELLKHSRVVVLGEPGSGKTKEFQERARSLRADSRFALFVPLERLIAQPWEQAIGPADVRLFQQWRRGDDEGFFFLDSVDETKLVRASDFCAALDRFQQALGDKGAYQSRILISSRITGWQPETDKQEVLVRFPAPPPPKQAEESIAQEKREAEEDVVLVVQLLPLDLDRVKQFATAVGVKDPNLFIQALEDSHAWEFARRPPDVIELANFWNSNERLGCLTELIENSTTCKLREDRDTHHPLTEEQARDGVETLAAATVFCRQYQFRVPDQAHIVTEGLNAADCLPENWRKEECLALLTRPVFESALYGSIRFHTRRVAEYLAAQWIGKRMELGCPVPVLEELLFSKLRDRRVLRQSMAPVAAWLCCGDRPWNDAVRQWVLEAAPRIHLQYGDPGRLSTAYKKKILQALVEQLKARDHTWLDSKPDALSRIAEPALVDDLRSILRDRSISSGLRSKMLQLVRYGKLAESLDVALEIISAPAEPDELKAYAAAAIRDAGTPDQHRRLAEIVAPPMSIPEHFGIRLCEALYPGTIGDNGLCDLLARIDVDSKRAAGLPWHVKRLVQPESRPETSEVLLIGLLKLFQTPPFATSPSGATPVSKRFVWIEEVLPSVLCNLFRKQELSQAETEDAAQALWLLGHAREVDRIRTELPDLNGGTQQHPAVRRAYLWKLVSEWRKKHSKEPSHCFQLFDYYEVLKPASGDFAWLLQDIRGRDLPQDREVALSLCLDLWHNSGRRRRDRRQIRRMISGDVALQGMFRKNPLSSSLFPLKAL
jgi:hypothetical protein